LDHGVRQNCPMALMNSVSLLKAIVKKSAIVKSLF
jgi:hypothetical protein